MKTKTNVLEKNFFSFDGTNPNLDWVYILVVYFIAVIYFVGGGVVLSISKGDADASANQTTSPSIISLNKKLIDSITNELSIKASDRAAYSAGYAGPQDPSGL